VVEDENMSPAEVDVVNSTGIPSSNLFPNLVVGGVIVIVATPS
jgi:hypothetical protein